ncbi:hypothetical protein CYMTET_11104, partial [Cymbomonas tetramitiformis]
MWSRLSLKALTMLLYLTIYIPLPYLAQGDNITQRSSYIDCQRTPSSCISLSLSRHSLTGTLPSQLGQLTAVTYLYLHYNSLTGTIPSQLGQLTAMTTLYLYYNSLTGTIPSQLGQLTALSHV